MFLEKPFETQRLILREFREEDWPAVHEYGCDRQVVRYMGWAPNGEEDSKAFVQRAVAGQREESRKTFDLAVIVKSDGRLVGGCGLHRQGDHSGFVGYCLNRDFWGQGYGTEAARALVGFGFERLGLHRIFATCDTRNRASEKVLRRVGMRGEGHLREHVWKKGEWRDSYLYAILEHEW